MGGADGGTSGRGRWCRGVFFNKKPLTALCVLIHTTTITPKPKKSGLAPLRGWVAVLYTSTPGHTHTVLRISPTTPGWSVKETKEVLLTKGNNPNIVLWSADPGSADGWIALGETLPHLSLNADTLDTNGVVNHTDTRTKKASVVNPMSPPHPRRLPGDGNDTVSFFITPNPLAFVDPLAHHTMTVYRMNTSFHRSAIATIDLPKVGARCPPPPPLPPLPMPSSIRVECRCSVLSFLFPMMGFLLLFSLFRSTTSIRSRSPRPGSSSLRTLSTTSSSTRRWGLTSSTSSPGTSTPTPRSMSSTSRRARSRWKPPTPPFAFTT